MAGSRYAYVRDFELSDVALPNTYLVVRIDGKGFHRFSERHGFAKPNDPWALELMNEAARSVMQEFKGYITLCFGESDEYSFLIDRNATLYNRRQSKLMTHITSLFTAAYVMHWPKFMKVDLQALPSFDGRIVAYPSNKNVRDYFAWRQADTHINNLYNTTFWALIQKGGCSEREAHDVLKGTVSADKHEILFSRYGINYDRLPALYRKGTTIVWSPVVSVNCSRQAKTKTHLRTLHVDIISDAFWQPCDAGMVSIDAKSGDDVWDEAERLETRGMGATILYSA